MHKIIIIIILLLTLSCSQRENKTSESIHAEQGNQNQVSSQIDVILRKIANKEFLAIGEYNSLSVHILKNKDESFSENVGYLLFKYFENDSKRSNEFVSFLNTKTKDYKKKLLNSMIEIMCIDLSEEKYNYEKLITNFNFYANEISVQKTFEECMNNQVH